jgi:hypothetical protein
MSPNRSTNRLSTLSLAIATTVATCAALAGAAGQAEPMSPAQTLARFQAEHQNSPIALNANGDITRVYGRAFSNGQSGEISAQRFVAQNAGIWGVSLDELVAEGPFADKHHTQPIGYLPDTDTYKFTGYYYAQTKNGIPVFQSKLVLLVRNEEDNPLVLASAQLHDLRNFQVDNQLAAAPVNQARIVDAAKKTFNTVLVDLVDTSRTIYAGTDSNPHQPTLSDISTITVDGFEKYLIVTDAATGAIIYQESLIHTIDVTGNVSALASEGPGADICATEVAQPLPWLFVNGNNGVTTMTDANGDFTLANPGVTPVTVDATLTGQWFSVSDFLGSVTSDSATVTPPGPADLFMNPNNNSENIRAQVNAYLEANRVRDLAIAANPAYPTLQATQFPVSVNRTDGFCPGNAWYDSTGGGSINFCLSGPSNPNTAWTSVIYHEYGHHLVGAGGSGQGQYGEGMGDVMSTIILDDPRLGLGFFNNCNTSLRNAEVGQQYPCNDAIHICGQIISGCVWDTRNELINSEPATYSEILSFLAINSILIHSGSEINPSITIDWLTLDDDDSDIGNGTPHYGEIAIGFAAHNMDAPPLNVLAISFPDSQPEFVSPNGTTSVTVQIDPISGTLDTSTPTLMVDSGSGFVAVAMSQLTGNQFSANFPSADCGSGVAYYVTADTTTGVTQTSPSDAPAASFSTTAAFGAPSIVFADDAETDMGWSVSGNATDGQWNRGVPVSCNRGDPGSDFDGSGKAYLTDNSTNGGDCNSDVDGGSTILTSPIMDASNGAVSISYARWYDNSFGADPGNDVFVVQVSDDGGSSWVNLETVGPTGPEASGGWVTKQFSLDSIPGFVPSNQFRIRFNASDLADGSVIEAGIDAVQLLSFDCNPCVADLNGDGELNFFDVSAFLSAFGAGDLSVDLNGDGSLDFFDVSAFLSAFSAGCP